MGARKIGKSMWYTVQYAHYTAAVSMDVEALSHNLRALVKSNSNRKKN